MRFIQPAVVPLAGTVLLFAGCATSPGAESSARPIHPARISHPVFFTLNDPADADELIADCDRLLPAIPAVASYACGLPHDTGRGSVDLNFDVGLYMGFDSDEEYAAYVVHPNHVALVDKWRPRLASLRVHDVIDHRLPTR